MVDLPPERPVGWRWQHVWPAIMVLIALAALIVGIVKGTRQQPSSQGLTPSTMGSSTSTSTLALTSTVATGAVAPSGAVPVILGRDLQAVTTEDCRAPGVGTGAAWQILKAELGPNRYEFAYSCNLFASQTGSLDFVLGNAYRKLNLSIGLDSASRATSHAVRFELVGNGTNYLAEPVTLRLGETRDLELDVTGVTRLSLRVTEQSRSLTTSESSRPIFAMPTLERI